MGDVKLAAPIGLVLGAQGLQYVAVAAGVAILAGGIGGVAALLAGRSRKDAIPFGSFPSAGAVAAAFLAPSNRRRGPLAASLDLHRHRMRDQPDRIACR